MGNLTNGALEKSVLYCHCERRVPMFNKRAKEILNILLTTESAITGNKLAEQLQVSNRTIRSDIRDINIQLISEGMEVKSRNPQGYYIDENDKTLLRMLLDNPETESDVDYIPDTPNERLNYILLCLITSDTYCSMNDMAEAIYVSKATVHTDVRRLISLLKNRKGNVQLQSNAQGIRFVGEELDLRIFATNVLTRQEQAMKQMMQTLRFISPQYKEMEAQGKGVYQGIIQAIEKQGIYLTDAEVHSLLIYMVISTLRIRQHHELTKYEENKRANALTMAIAACAVNHFHTGMGKAEVLAIMERLEGKRIVKMDGLQQSDEKINQVIDAFLEKVKVIYGLDFSGNHNLRQFLYLHIQPMIHRLRKQESEENPLKDDIKKKFPLAIEISFLLMDEIKTVFALQMNDSEISYIALHIAAALEVQYTPAKVILVSDLGASPLQLMRSKLMNHFTNKITLMEAYTEYEFEALYQKQQLPECDLIVTTSRLQIPLSIPMVMISPLVMREDISHIKHYIHYYATEIKDKDKFISLFDPDLFLIEHTKKSYYEIIHKLVEKVKEQEIIEDVEEYYNYVIQREEAYSTIMGNRIAIPHAAENIAHKTVIATAVLKTPIEHDGKKISLILLNVMNEKEDLQTMYAAIEKMLEITSVEPLTQVESYEEFIGKL